MKKKSKDLTVEEVTNICRKLSCLKCPFNVLEEDRCMTYFEILNLDQEIEVEENDR